MNFNAGDFPRDFLWGTATSAHQVEGGNEHCDWWDWEKIPGKIKRDEASGRACDHWGKFEEDLTHLVDLGVNAYRFSVEWAKIEPRVGEINLEAVAHYRKRVQLLLAAGIEPLVTLHHFTSPQWLAEKGLWEWSRTTDSPVGDAAAAAFGGYAKLVYREIAPECTRWCTVNEPLVHLGGAYVLGVTPPEKKGFRYLRRPLTGLFRAHVEAYRALHEEARTAKRKIEVGMAHHFRIFDPKQKWNPLDVIAAHALDRAFNWTAPMALETGVIEMRVPGLVNICEKIAGLAGTQDYCGLNYYSRDIVALGFRDGKLEPVPRTKPDRPTNDLGWELYPKGFLRVLRAVHKRLPHRKILILENGIADHDDSRRPGFIRDHLDILAQALRERIPITGYFHWSLMDNFEWIEGYEPRFGLIEIDYETLQRKRRPSFYTYRDLIRR